MKKIVLLIVIALSTQLFSQEKASATYSNDFPAYVIYNDQGQQVTYSQMIESIKDTDVLLFGEQHNDPISHWMEISLLKTLHKLKGDKLVVGAEMWEADNQLIMDEMLVQKLVDGQSYVESSKLWPNFDTDYLPIIKFVKSNNLPFICTNIPRRYARIVYKHGIEYLDSLSPLAKTYMPPLPIHFDLTQPVYAKMSSVFPSDEEFEKSQAQGVHSKGAMQGSKPSNLVKAQAIKDATMAHFILKNWEPGKFFYHFNGEFHSANHDSIEYYLKYYNAEVNVKTISVLKKEDLLDFDVKYSKANFNIVVQADMTLTYISSAF